MSRFRFIPSLPPVKRGEPRENSFTSWAITIMNKKELHMLKWVVNWISDIYESGGLYSCERTWDGFIFKPFRINRNTLLRGAIEVIENQKIKSDLSSNDVE